MRTRTPRIVASSRWLQQDRWARGALKQTEHGRIVQASSQNASKCWMEEVSTPRMRLPGLGQLGRQIAWGRDITCGVYSKFLLSQFSRRSVWLTPTMGAVYPAAVIRTMFPFPAFPQALPWPFSTLSPIPVPSLEWARLPARDGVVQTVVYRSRSMTVCVVGSLPSPTLPARSQAASGLIDKLVAGKPVALQRSYVFQSPEDHTVVKQSGQASIDFLTALIGKPPIVDRGNAVDGSDRAGHGFISPDGTDSCQSDGKEKSYVRRCGAEDNAGKLLLAIYDPGSTYDSSKRVKVIPGTEVWEFKQQPLIDKIRKSDGKVAADGIWWFPFSSERRKNFDMAGTGYLYVPPSVEVSGAAVGYMLHFMAANRRRKSLPLPRATTTGRTITKSSLSIPRSNLKSPLMERFALCPRRFPLRIQAG